MKKNKKKILASVIGVVVLGLVALLIYFIANLKDSNSLTLEEDKWIESNKSNVIDVAVMNDIPIVGYEGEGLVYDYLDYTSKELSLKFNVIPYKLDGNANYQYKVYISDTTNDKDLVLLKDNLVLITNNTNTYKNVDSINNLKLGILASDKTLLTTYFKDKNIEFVEYSTYEELKNSIMNESTNNEQPEQIVEPTTTIDGIIIPKTLFIKELLENNLNIAFQFNDLNKYFTLGLGSDKDLNSILTKTFNKFKEEKYHLSYNENLLENYFDFKEVSDVEQKTLKSKNYVYGFINYGIYNHLEDNKISGLNELILKDFNEFSSLSISYTQYNSISNLIKDFNNKKVDFILNINSSVSNNVYATKGIFDKDIAVITGINNNSVIESIYSLRGKEVLAIKDSYIEKYLTDNNVKVKLYNNLEDLVSDFGAKDIALVDLENYNYYKSSEFADTKINYIITMDDKYNYLINDTADNKVFKDLFNFYLSYVSINDLVYSNYDDIAYKNTNIVYILVLIIVVLAIYVIVDFSSHVKLMIKTIKKNKKVNLSKEDKLKYIDQLTSLKNRAYLNSRIESWDESDIYPQSIIVIDLNNVSYINDNYGREEGDKVITEAANILIMNQLQNSEIIRTDGNEFLIYLVGYSEKQVISYLRKLNKELKGLSHGFGAASGYSIINDAIKTVDDAVNEATLDMKNNKEDIDY